MIQTYGRLCQLFNYKAYAKYSNNQLVQSMINNLGSLHLRISGCLVQRQLDQPQQPDWRPDRLLLRLLSGLWWPQRGRPRWRHHRGSDVDQLPSDGQVRDRQGLRGIPKRQRKFAFWSLGWGPILQTLVILLNDYDANRFYLKWGPIRLWQRKT